MASLSTAARPPEPSAWRRCPVCGSDASQALYVSFAALDFAQCGRCRLVYKSRAACGEDAGFYEASYFHGRKSARDGRFAHRVRKCQRQLRAAVAAAGAVRRVLDIGCSFGYVLEAARRLGMQADGSDISLYAVQVCQSRGYRAAVGTLDAQPFAAGAFDLVTLKHVLEHTPHPLVALAEVRRVLAPGGLALIVVPSVAYFKARWWRRRGRYFRPDDLGRQHYVYYSRQTLAAALERAGFAVLGDSRALARVRVLRAGGWRGALESARAGAADRLRRLAAAVGLEREVSLLARVVPGAVLDAAVRPERGVSGAVA